MTNRRPLPKRLTGIVVGLATVTLLLTSAVPMASAAPFAYITNTGSNPPTVSVFDAATNTLVGTVPVGLNPSGIAVSPAGDRVYVANFGEDTVSVIQTTMGTDQRPSFSVIATVRVGSLPSAVAVNADGSKVYVASGDGTVSVIDAGSNMVTRVFDTRGSLVGIAINPAGTRVYVTDAFSNGVIVLDANAPVGSNGVITSVFIGDSPGGLALNPAGTRLYVAAVQTNDNLDGGLWVVNTEPNASGENTVIGTPFTVGLGPMGVAVSPSGAFIYVANAGERTMSVIHMLTNTVTSIPVGTSPIGVATDPPGARIFVGNQGDPSLRPPVAPSVSVIDASTNRVTATITSGLGRIPAVFGAFVGGAPSPTSPSSPSGDQLAELQRQLDAATARVRALEAEKTTLLQRVASLENNLDIARADLATANADKAELTRQVNALTAQNAMFDQQVKALQAEISRLEGQIAPLAAEYARMKIELDEARLTITSFLRRLITGRTDANVASAARDAAKRDLDRAVAKAGRSDHRVRHAQKEMNQGLAHFAAGQFQRSVKDFVEVCEIAHRILR